MKHSIVLSLLTIILSFHGYGQKQCDIRNHFEDFISIQKETSDDKDYLIKRVNPTEKKSCYSELVNHNIAVIDYLLTNFSSNASNQSLLQLKDSVSLRKAYFAELKKDSLFNSLMTSWVDKTINKKSERDSVSMDALMNIAVKYFSIMRVTEDGNFVGKVCIGLNDIKKNGVSQETLCRGLLLFIYSETLSKRRV